MIFLVICFISCNNIGSKRKKVEYKRDNSIGKKLILPQKMMLYHPFLNSNNIDSTQIANSPLKIYSLVDGSCVECVGSIKKWIDFTKMTNIPIVLIISSEDDQFNLFKYVCKEGEFKYFKYPFFLDVESKYYNLNRKLFTSKGAQTVLTNVNNKILLTGNPILNHTIQKDYLNKIKSYKN